MEMLKLIYNIESSNENPSWNLPLRKLLSTFQLWRDPMSQTLLYESTSLWIHVDVTFEKDCYSMIISYQYSKSFQNRNILIRDWGSLYVFCKKSEDLVILVTFKAARVRSCCFPREVRSEKEAAQPIPTRERAIKTHPPYHNLSTL